MSEREELVQSMSSWGLIQLFISLKEFSKTSFFLSCQGLLFFYPHDSLLATESMNIYFTPRKIARILVWRDWQGRQVVIWRLACADAIGCSSLGMMSWLLPVLLLRGQAQRQRSAITPPERTTNLEKAFMKSL